MFFAVTFLVSLIIVLLNKLNCSGDNSICGLTVSMPGNVHSRELSSSSSISAKKTSGILSSWLSISSLANTISDLNLKHLLPFII